LFNYGIKARNPGVVNFHTFYEHLNAHCLVCYTRSEEEEEEEARYYVAILF